MDTKESRRRSRSGPRDREYRYADRDDRDSRSRSNRRHDADRRGVSRDGDRRDVPRDDDLRGRGGRDVPCYDAHDARCRSHDADRRDVFRDGDRRGRGREVLGTASPKSRGIPPLPFVGAASFPPRPPSWLSQSASRDFVKETLESLERFTDMGTLDNFVRGLPDKLYLELTAALLRHMDSHRARALPAKVAEGAFKLLAPVVSDSIQKWSPDDRAVLYKCPPELNPDMSSVGTSEQDRLQNFTKLQELFRERYLPLAPSKQKRYIKEYNFKVFTISKKANTRYRETVKTMPWKSSLAEWGQFKKFLKEFKFDPHVDLTDTVDALASESESLLQKLLGDSAYAEQFEDEEDAEEVPGQHVDAEPVVGYMHTDITCLKSDRWEDTVAVIPKGSEVAVLESQSDWALIRHGGSKGWIEEHNVKSTPPAVQRFINHPSGPVQAIDDDYLPVLPKLQHGSTVSVTESAKNWRKVATPIIPNGGWISADHLSEEKPVEKGGKGGSKGKNKGKKGETYTQEDFERETWPTFAFNGPSKAVGALNAEALRRLKVFSERSQENKKKTEKHAAAFSKQLDKLFPDELPIEDVRWKSIKKVIGELAVESERVQWNRTGLVTSLKTLFTRLHCLKDADQ